jgi:hypothetical protein
MKQHQHKTHLDFEHMGESTLWWTKNVVTNITCVELSPSQYIYIYILFIYLFYFFLINRIHNKVIQNPKTKIVKRNFFIDVKWLKSTFVKIQNICNKIIHKNIYIFIKKFKWLSNLMNYLVIYWIWIDYIISTQYERFHSCDFTNNIWMRFFIQTNINVWKVKRLLVIHFWKVIIIVLEGLVSKVHFMCFSKH